ncbi:MAG: AraC family transcriptional regulator [Chitinophagaceae bacterium]|nr:MAG: AraC family transcriptional regulator [Chitinophagaceae bacterium]
MKKQGPRRIDTVADYHTMVGLPAPEHPLLSVIDIVCPAVRPDLPDDSMYMGLYNIFLKRNIDGMFGYGRRNYDFSNGIMGFSSPGQVFSFNHELDLSKISGILLLIHPDFLRNHPVQKKMEDLGFFSYNMNEALHLSPREEIQITRIMTDIREEYLQPIDAFSRDVVISHVDVLLNYANRFYNRQFITRSTSAEEPVLRFEALLNGFFAKEEITVLPAVQDLAAQMNISAHYLSDMLRSLTGMSAQQHIHNKLIEKAKAILLSTSLSVNETAYQLGFEYPQYFNRLFKSKTGLTPAAFRKAAMDN